MKSLLNAECTKNLNYNEKQSHFGNNQKKIYFDSYFLGKKNYSNCLLR